MANEVRDTFARVSLYAEVLREGAILLGIFGPIASLEIIKSLPWKLALAIWGMAVVMLVIGVESEVRIRRKERDIEGAKHRPDLSESFFTEL
jgi:hypothetical protein